MTDEVRLEGGSMTHVVRVGNTVRRSPGRQSAAVQALLRHLESEGVDGAPRALGFDDQGRETVTFIDGELGFVWDDDVLPALGNNEAFAEALARGLARFVTFLGASTLGKEKAVDVKWFFAGVAVADYPSARAWYERLMGRPPDFNPHENEAVWQIIENGWIYVVADTERAGTALLTLMVDNLDRHVAELKERGLAVGAIETQPGRFRKAEVIDPEGNKISFGQALSPGND